MSSAFLFSFLCLGINTAFSTQTSRPLMRVSPHTSQRVWTELHTDGSFESASDEPKNEFNADGKRELIVQSDATTLNALIERRTAPSILPTASLVWTVKSEQYCQPNWATDWANRVPGKSVPECQSMCIANPNCKAVTYGENPPGVENCVQCTSDTFSSSWWTTSYVPQAKNEGPTAAMAAPTSNTTGDPRFDVEEIGKLLLMGMQAISDSMQYFLVKPPDVQGAISHFNTSLWAIVEEIVPPNRKDDSMWLEGKQLWAQLFDSVGDLMTGIEEFQTTGNQAELVKDIEKVLSIPLEVGKLIWPASIDVFLAIQECLDGVADSWDFFEKGEWDAGISALYGDVSTAIRAVLPSNNKTDKTVDIVFGVLDATLGDLHQHVTDFKREIDNARVCYRTFPHRERLGRPDKCQAGYQYDGVVSCIPDKEQGADCWKPCGKEAGFCPQYCGQGKACCKRNEDNDPCECLEVGGYVDNPQGHGSPDDYYQCITAGPWRSEDPANLLAVSDVQLGSLDRALLGKKDQDEGKPTDKCPFKAAVIPSLAAIAGDLTSKRQNRTRVTQTLERSLGPKDVEYGSMEAKCSSGELIHGYCYGPCPATYRIAGMRNKCETDCSQLPTHPVAAGLWCGMDMAAVVTAGVRIFTMIMDTGITAANLIQNFTKHGATGDNIGRTITAVVNAAKPLAKPLCSNIGGDKSLLAQDESFDEAKAYIAFKRFDRNHNGTLERGEIEAALRRMGLRAKVTDKVMASVDTNKDGTLQFNEVIALEKNNKLGYSGLLSRVIG